MNLQAQLEQPDKRTLGLLDKAVVITRVPHQSHMMTDLLDTYGAKPLYYPCIDIVPPDDTTELDAALEAASAGSYDWLLFTSANTVWMLAQRPGVLDLEMADLQVAAVGSRTAAAVEKLLHLEVDVVAPKFTAGELAAALQTHPGQRYLLPQSAIARPLLAHALRASGADVTIVEAYQVVMGTGGDDVPALLADRKIDGITFTSSSTARNFLKRLEQEGGQRDDLNDVCLAAIGPITAETMQALGLEPDVVPIVYTMPAMVAAMASYYAPEEEE